MIDKRHAWEFIPQSDSKALNIYKRDNRTTPGHSDHSLIWAPAITVEQLFKMLSMLMGHCTLGLYLPVRVVRKLTAASLLQFIGCVYEEIEQITRPSSFSAIGRWCVDFYCEIHWAEQSACIRCVFFIQRREWIFNYGTNWVTKATTTLTIRISISLLVADDFPYICNRLTCNW